MPTHQSNLNQFFKKRPRAPPTATEVDDDDERAEQAMAIFAAQATARASAINALSNAKKQAVLEEATGSRAEVLLDAVVPPSAALLDMYLNDDEEVDEDDLDPPPAAPAQRVPASITFGNVVGGGGGGCGHGDSGCPSTCHGEAPRVQGSQAPLVGVPYNHKREYAQHTVVVKKGRLYKLYLNKRDKYRLKPLCKSCAAVGRVVTVKTTDGVCKECAGTSKRVPWSLRYDELKDVHCPNAGARLLAPLDTWEDACTGANFKPDLECLEHPGVVISTTSITKLVIGRLGCVQCNASMQRWATLEGYDRLVAECAKVGAKLLAPRETWVDVCTGAYFKPYLECLKHPDVVISTTSIGHLVNGQLGCVSCDPSLKLWATLEGYDRLVTECAKAGARLLNVRETWTNVCTGDEFKPDLECLAHPDVVISTTSIGHLVNGRLGCVSCEPSMQLWATLEGYDRLVVECAKVGARILDVRATWEGQCTGVHFKPDLECLAHPGTVISTTSIHNLVNHGSLGCPKCRHKTEAKLSDWLQARDTGWRHNVLKLKNPATTGTMSVDFDHPELRLAIELDGNITGGHFDDDPANECPVRDLEKERQLLVKGYQVLRVLQEDVWADKNGWENWLLGEMARWRARCEAGALAEAARHPVAPEYLGGVYARLRAA